MTEQLSLRLGPEETSWEGSWAVRREAQQEKWTLMTRWPSVLGRCLGFSLMIVTCIHTQSARISADLAFICFAVLNSCFVFSNFLRPSFIFIYFFFVVVFFFVVQFGKCPLSRVWELTMGSSQDGRTINGQPTRCLIYFNKSLSFIFPSVCGLPERQNQQNNNIFFSYQSILGLVIWLGFGDPFVSLNPSRIICVSLSRTDSGLGWYILVGC